MRARLAVWALVATLVVLTTRAIVYALVPQSALLAALSHNRVGPNVTVPLIGGVAVAISAAAAVLWLAVSAVRERLLLEGRRLVEAPRLRPAVLAGRALALFCISSFSFAMLESYIHWRAGLGWHGLHCLLGPVHRDAIPVLAGLSALAIAVHGALEHLIAWARRLFAQLAARTRWPSGRLRDSHRAPGIVRAARALLLNGPRGPPRFTVPVPADH